MCRVEMKMKMNCGKKTLGLVPISATSRFFWPSAATVAVTSERRCRFKEDLRIYPSCQSPSTYLLSNYVFSNIIFMASEREFFMIPNKVLT